MTTTNTITETFKSKKSLYVRKIDGKVIKNELPSVPSTSRIVDQNCKYVPSKPSNSRIADQNNKYVPSVSSTSRIVSPNRKCVATTSITVPPELQLTPKSSRRDRKWSTRRKKSDRYEQLVLDITPKRNILCLKRSPNSASTSTRGSPLEITWNHRLAKSGKRSNRAIEGRKLDLGSANGELAGDGNDTNVVGIVKFLQPEELTDGQNKLINLWDVQRPSGSNKQQEKKPLRAYLHKSVEDRGESTIKETKTHENEAALTTKFTAINPKSESTFNSESDDESLLNTIASSEWDDKLYFQPTQPVDQEYTTELNPVKTKPENTNTDSVSNFDPDWDDDSLFMQLTQKVEQELYSKNTRDKPEIDKVVVNSVDDSDWDDDSLFMQCTHKIEQAYNSTEKSEANKTVLNPSQDPDWDDDSLFMQLTQQTEQEYSKHDSHPSINPVPSIAVVDNSKLPSNRRNENNITGACSSKGILDNEWNDDSFNQEFITIMNKIESQQFKSTKIETTVNKPSPRCTDAEIALKKAAAEQKRRIKLAAKIMKLNR